jgi:toxin CcdB
VAQFLMARFDVFVNPGKLQDSVPYVLDVQRDHLAGLVTRIVIPLRRRDHFPVVRLPEDLIRIFEIYRVKLMMDTPAMAAVPRSELGTPVASPATSHSEIRAALDRLFGAF